MSSQQVDSDQTLDAFPMLTVPIPTNGQQSLHTPMDTNPPVTFASTRNTSGQYVNPLRPQSLQIPMDTNTPITIASIHPTSGMSVPMDVNLGDKYSLQTSMDTKNPPVTFASTRNTSGQYVNPPRTQSLQIPMDTNTPVIVANACTTSNPYRSTNTRWMTKRQWGIMPRGVLILMCAKCLSSFKDEPFVKEDNAQGMHISVCLDCVKRNKSCRFE